MIIGFDFDKVFINYPPLIPDFLINLLYRRGATFFIQKKEKKLTYTFPGQLEQKIRIFSHAPILRSQIKHNVKALKQIKQNKKHQAHLISSRYSFLKERTDRAIKKHGLSKCFRTIHFNYENEQPHLFKEKMLKKLRIKAYVDDDLATLKYLSGRNLKIKLYWLTKNINLSSGSSNIKPVKKISEITEFFR